MVFIDVKITEGVVQRFAKLKCKEEEPLRVAVENAIAEYLEDTEEEVDRAAITEVIGRITSINCKQSSLKRYLDDEEATLSALNSARTPILTIGFDVVLAPKRDKQKALTAPSKKRNIASVSELRQAR